MAHDPGRSGHDHSRDHAGHDHGAHGHGAHDHAAHGHAAHGHGAHGHHDHENDRDAGAGWDGDVGDGLDTDDEVGLKEAFGLPDELPPVRLPAEAELAATARAIPMLAELAALADWVGDGRAIDAAAELSAADKADARSALKAPAERFAFLWKYAGAVDWIEETDDGQVVSGETAAQWREDDDGGVISAWSATFAAVLTEAMCAASAAPGRPDEVDFHVPGAGLAMMFFMARREGLTREEVSEIVEDGLTAELTQGRARRAWSTWRQAHGDPAAVLLDQLTEIGAISDPSALDGTIRLTPLALHEMRLQFTDAGVDVPLLPEAPGDMTAAQLVALADGVSDDEFEAESAAWLAAHDPGQAASELLDVAADGDPADRLLAVAVVTDLGAAAEPAWRGRLATRELRPYAKVALAGLGGLTETDVLPPDLQPDSDDLAWMATDLLAIVCDDEDTDADEISEAFAEALPPDGDPAAFLEMISRGSHPYAADVLEHIGEFHPDKAIAKEARKVAYKAAMREAARQRAGGSATG
jgi:hypothetical protein